MAKDFPIIEAACEFRFDENKEWDWTIPGIIYEKIRKEFPLKKQDKAMAILIDADTGKVSPAIDKGIEKMRFFREDESALIQVGLNLLAINHLQPYPGWNDFKKLIHTSFDTYKMVANPTAINRVGLRYINRFERNEIESVVSEHFNIWPQIPIEQPIKNFFMRSEFFFEKIDSILVVTLGSQLDKNLGKEFIMLDFDMFTTNKDLITNNSWQEWLDNAHHHLNDVFKSCVSEEIRKHLKEDIV